MTRPRPYIVGISGGSASGKTFLLNQLLAQFSAGQLTLISLDNYYKPLEEQRRDEDGLINFDHPDSLDLGRLEKDVQRLTQNKKVILQEYTFNQPDVVPRTLVFEPAPLLVIEGLFVFNRESLARMIDLKVFVDADEHIRLSRRLHRDIRERGASIEEILRDYVRFVAPMYRVFIEPYKADCDLIIPNNQHMYRAVNVLVNHLKMCLQQQG